MANTLAFVWLTADSTDEEIIGMMVSLRDRRLDDHERKRLSKIYLGIHGFDTDPRELWEVAEVRQLCQKLIDFGFISYLDFCGSLDDDFRKDAGPPFGAAEVILCAENRITDPMEWTKELHRELFDRWVETNERADELVLRQKETKTPYCLHIGKES